MDAEVTHTHTHTYVYTLTHTMGTTVTLQYFDQNTIEEYQISSTVPSRLYKPQPRSLWHTFSQYITTEAAATRQAPGVVF